MKILALAALLVSTAPAHAGVIACTFTEPFLTIRVDESTQEVTFRNETEKREFRFPAQQITKDGNYSLVVFGAGGNNAWNLEYDLDGQGSDGMSDQVYPYSAVLTKGVSDLHHGGCKAE
jgi:uncharacterized membrane protein